MGRALKGDNLGLGFRTHFRTHYIPDLLHLDYRSRELFGSPGLPLLRAFAGRTVYEIPVHFEVDLLAGPVASAIGEGLNNVKKHRDREFLGLRVKAVVQDFDRVE